MSNVTVIGITGAARAGKDTVAGLITDALATRAHVIRYSLACPIKAMVQIVLDPFIGFQEDEADLLLYSDAKDDVFLPLGKSPREMMQSLGTEWGRGMVSDTLWIDMANAIFDAGRRRSAMPADPTPIVYIVPDIRFDNEAAICDWIINVIRPEKTSINASGHASEAGVSTHLINSTLYNDAGIDELRDKVNYWVEDLPALWRTADA